MAQDRAAIIATTIYGMVVHTLQQFLRGEPVDTGELRESVAGYLRDEFTDAERQWRNDQAPID
jgi:hypothetical protein